MVMTPHAVTSALITVLLEEMRIRHRLRRDKKYYAIIAVASFASHFLLDSIPHYGYSIYTNDLAWAHRLGLDFSFVLCALVFIFWPQVKIIIESIQYPTVKLVDKELDYASLLLLTSWGIFFSWLPDILRVFNHHYRNLILTLFQRFHDLFHNSIVPGIWSGIFIQAAICVIFALTVKNRMEKIEKKIRTEKRAELADHEFAKLFSLNDQNQ